MVLTIYTDGGSSGNPGPSASAFVYYLQEKIVLKKSFFLGNKTNNQAEYQAIVFSLEHLIKNRSSFPQVDGVEFFSDSSLVVNQLSGLFRIKNKKIREVFNRVKILELKLGLPVSYCHILREKNTEADSLVKGEIEKHFFSYSS